MAEFAMARIGRKTKIMTIHKKMPMSDYLAIPAVSASIIRTIVDDCPRAAWCASWRNPDCPEDNTVATDIGTIAHSILLEGNSDNVVVIDPHDHPAEKTRAIPEGWTNKSIRAARDEARDAGKIPVLKNQFVSINNMVSSAHAFIAALAKTEPAIWHMFHGLGDSGESEITITWENDGIPCRIRPDRISADRRIIVDVKTTATSPHPDKWGRSQMINGGLYVGASFYRIGCAREFGVTPDYVYLVIGQEPPHLCSLVGIDQEGYHLGLQKVSAGLDTWAKCIKTNYWPAYPSRVCYPQIPPWIACEWAEKDAQMQGIEYDKESNTTLPNYLEVLNERVANFVARDRFSSGLTRDNQDQALARVAARMPEEGEIMKPEKLSAVSIMHLNSAEKVETSKEWRIGRLRIVYHWRSPNNFLGRFGGGWNWKVGAQAGSQTLILDLLIFSVRFQLS